MSDWDVKDIVSLVCYKHTLQSRRESRAESLATRRVVEDS
jgi:hypothetical protein